MHRSERRIVRPVLTLDTVLEDTAMRLHPCQEFTTEPNLQLPPEGNECAPQVRPATRKTVLQEHCGDMWDKLVFVLYAIERAIHRSACVFVCLLDEIPDEIDLVAADRSGQIYWSGVTSYVACIALAESGPATSGKGPYRKGHWIARKRFDVQSRLPSEGFPIEVWSADRFEQLGLPGRTAFYVLIEDEQALLDQPDSIDNVVRVAVHEDVAFAVNRDRAMQHMLAIEVASEILYRGLRAAVHNGLAVSGLPEYSYIARWVSALRRGTGIAENSLLQAVRDENYAFVRSVVQSRYDLLSELARTSRS